MVQQTTELATVNRQTGLSIYERVDPMDFIDRMGKVFALTGAGGAQTESDGKLLALACVSRGVDVFQLTQTHHLIGGKLSKKADVMLAEFRQLGGKHRWIKDGMDGLSATLELTPKGEAPSTYTFTIEMAKNAGYVKSGSQWVKRPDQMLRARCITDLIGMVAPELKAGEVSEEEMRDVVATVTATTSAATPTAPTRSADDVAARQRELKEMASTGTPAQSVPAAQREAQSAKNGDVVDAEFVPAVPAANPTTSSTVGTAPSQTPPASSAPLQSHQEQSVLMEIELTVGKIPGASLTTLVDSINKLRQQKNETPITELGQLQPAQLSAILGNLQKVLAKQQTPSASA